MPARSMMKENDDNYLHNAVESNRLQEMFRCIEASTPLYHLLHPNNPNYVVLVT